MESERIRVITKLPNSEQSNKGKVKTHKYMSFATLFQCCLTPNEEFCNSFQYFVSVSPYEYIHRITDNKIKHVAMATNM